MTQPTSKHRVLNLHATPMPTPSSEDPVPELPISPLQENVRDKLFNLAATDRKSIPTTTFKHVARPLTIPASKPSTRLLTSIGGSGPSIQSIEKAVADAIEASKSELEEEIVDALSDHPHFPEQMARAIIWGKVSQNLSSGRIVLENKPGVSITKIDVIKTIDKQFVDFFMKAVQYTPDAYSALREGPKTFEALTRKNSALFSLE